MNWKRILLNLAGIAAGGFAAAVTQHATGAPLDGHVIANAVALPVVANVIGLFQPQPHAE